MDIESNEILCNVCMSNKNDLIKCNQCTWLMCEDCFCKYIKYGNTCPQCKILINNKNIIRNGNILILYRSEVLKKYKLKIIILCIFCICWMYTWLFFGCKILSCKIKNYNNTRVSI